MVIVTNTIILLESGEKKIMHVCKDITNLNFSKDLYFSVRVFFGGLNRNLNTGLIEMLECHLNTSRMQTIRTVLL